MYITFRDEIFPSSSRILKITQGNECKHQRRIIYVQVICKDRQLRTEITQKICSGAEFPDRIYAQRKRKFSFDKFICPPTLIDIMQHHQHSATTYCTGVLEHSTQRNSVHKTTKFANHSSVHTHRQRERKSCIQSCTQNNCQPT